MSGMGPRGSVGAPFDDVVNTTVKCSIHVSHLDVTGLCPGKTAVPVSREQGEEPREAAEEPSAC